MIPKIIHYCWFGKGEKNPLINKCIESWKRYCSDYEIIEWNEKNFDINVNRFAKEAYESKKYAFVSDYVRLHVLDEYGGVYVDTDLEIRKNIDDFLKHRAFSSFETKDYIPTAIMGAEKGHPWIKNLLNYYYDKSFILENGSMDMTPNPKIITRITKENYGLVLNNKEQVLKEGVHIYPNYVLCYNLINKENYSTHHFNGSWINDKNFYKAELLKYKKNYTILTDLLIKIEEKKELDFPIERYNRIYLFGSGNITKYLIKYFNKLGYEVDGVISSEDKNIIFGIKGIHIDNVGTIKSDDLIIVVPSYDFNDICDELSAKTNAELVSIEYIFNIEIMYA